MADHHDSGENVLAFRGPSGEPVVVPSEVAAAGERAYRCYQARIGGQSWTEIAQAEGYPSAAACKAEVDRHLEMGKALVAESSARQMLTLEISRLDAVQNALWPGAMRGHVPSAMGVVNIVMNRAKLAGLDPEKMSEEAQRTRTVVVPAEQDDYVAALQRAAGGAGTTQL